MTEEKKRTSIDPVFMQVPGENPQGNSGQAAGRSRFGGPGMPYRREHARWIKEKIWIGHSRLPGAGCCAAGIGFLAVIWKQR